MKTDAIWQAFAETGDPVYYLLHKSMEDKKGQKKSTNKPGQQPRPED